MILNTKPAPTIVIGNQCFPSMQEVEFENVTYTMSATSGGNRLTVTAPPPGMSLDFDYYTLASEYTSKVEPSTSPWNLYPNTAQRWSIGNHEGIYNPSWGSGNAVATAYTITYEMKAKTCYCHFFRAKILASATRT